MVMMTRSRRRRYWADMPADILATIFGEIPADEIAGSVARVCKPWLSLVRRPDCWTRIDLSRWCGRNLDRGTDSIDEVVCYLIKKGNFNCQSLTVFLLGETGFSLTADCGRCLTVLQMPFSIITDETVLKHAKSLPNLTVLDISHCSKITYEGLQAFGEHCKSLVKLKRNMDCLQTTLETERIDDGEAMVIANTMEGLRNIELRFGLFGDDGLTAILTNCDQLQSH